MSVSSARRPAITRASPAQLKKYFELKLAAELGPHNVKRLLDAGAADLTILDVRSAEGYREGHLPGAINIPFEALASRLKELSKQHEIIAYCWDTTCTLSTKAAYVLASNGFRAREMIGGMEEWQQSGFPIEV